MGIKSQEGQRFAQENTVQQWEQSFSFPAWQYLILGGNAC